MAAMWEPHGWRTVAPRTEHFCIVFMPEFLAADVIGEMPWLSLFAAPPDRRPRVDDHGSRQSLLSLGQMMKHEVEERLPAWEQMTRLYVSQVLILLERCWPLSAKSQGERRERHTDLARIMPALELLRLREGQVSVTDVASACSMSRSHFELGLQAGHGN